MGTIDKLNRKNEAELGALDLSQNDKGWAAFSLSSFEHIRNDAAKLTAREPAQGAWNRSHVVII